MKVKVIKLEENSKNRITRRCNELKRGFQPLASVIKKDAADKTSILSIWEQFYGNLLLFFEVVAFK